MQGRRFQIFGQYHGTARQVVTLPFFRLDYPWEAIDIQEHDRLAAADKAAKTLVL